MGSRLFRLGLIVGRFQPLHLGHMDMIDRAAELCDDVLVFVGSSQESGTGNNPFTYELRKEMLEAVYGNRICVRPLPDVGLGNNSAWGRHVLGSAEACMGQAPDLFVSGTETRRRSWFSGIDGIFPSSLMVPKRLPISAVNVRRLLAEGDLEGWKACVDPAMYGLYGVLREAVLTASNDAVTASL